jgi:hypothetical protein
MYRAEAAINICRIVTDVGTTNPYGLLVPADATVKPLGVSGSDQKFAPISGYTDSSADVHAAIGDPVTVFSQNSGSEADNEVLVLCGGTIAQGAPIMAKADGSGKAITGTTGKWIVGYAKEAGVDGNYIRMTLAVGFLGTVS